MLFKRAEHFSQMTRKRALRLPMERLEVFSKALDEFLASPYSHQLVNFKSHGRTTCLTHSIAVAYLAMVFVDRLNAKVDEKSMLRAAFLHDYYLYDWHEKSDWHRLHGYSHAKIAVKNAVRDFNINELEQSIIRTHMFPLNLLSMPKSKEAWLVTMADKCCAIYEAFNPNAYVRSGEDMPPIIFVSDRMKGQV